MTDTERAVRDVVAAERALHAAKRTTATTKFSHERAMEDEQRAYERMNQAWTELRGVVKRDAGAI